MNSCSKLFLMLALSVVSLSVTAHSGHEHQEESGQNSAQSNAGSTADYVSPLLEEPCLLEENCLAMTLGSQATWTITKTAANSKLVMNQKQLEYVDPQAWITIAEDNLASLSPQESRLIVSVPYSSPSFGRILVPVQEVDVVSGQVLKVHVLELRVASTVIIEFYGDRAGGMYFMAPDTIQLQAHATPVKVKFVNSRDNGTEHRVHAEGAIKHSPSTSMLTKVGDFYEYDVVDKEPVEARYYCHNHDSSLDQKKIKFNVTKQDELRAAVQFPDALSQ